MPTCKEMRELLDKTNKEFEEREERRRQEWFKELEARGLQPFDTSQVPPQRCDHPNTIENSTATIFWIVAMFISILFKGGWVLCIIETIIWFKFVTRYKK